MRYWSRAAILLLRDAGRISFRISARARSAIRWAETMISSSSGSLTARSPESRSAAGTSSQGRARARAPCSRTVMYASSNPQAADAVTLNGLLQQRGIAPAGANLLDDGPPDVQ